MERIVNAFDLFRANIVEYFLSGVVIVSLIIVFIGMIKPFVFDRIKHKQVRKVALFGTDMGASLLSTAIYFGIEKIPFTNYWVGAISICLFSTLVYALYENTCLKEGVHKLGSMAIKKILNIIANYENKDKAIKDIKSASQELKADAKTELNKINKRIEKEFEGL